ncbi:oxamate carbamoyltransferase subunit AllH family protein [Oerskovia turbata]
MPTDVALPAPQGLRRDVALGDERRLVSLEVVHVGHSALVLGAGRDIVPVTAPDRWLVPGGFQVTSEEDWATLHDLARRAGAAGWTVTCAAWRDAATPCDLTVARALAVRTAHDAAAAPPYAGPTPPKRSAQHRAARDHGVQGPAVPNPAVPNPAVPNPAVPNPAVPNPAVQDRAAWLAEWSATSPAGTPASLDEARRPLLALAADALAGAPGALFGLVGAGPGTTPTGDDLVVGLLAGLQATGELARARRLGEDVLGLLDRTTRASRHELAAAADGRFGEALLDVVAALTAPTARAGELATAAARLATWGASSGRDQAHGAALAARPPQTTP